MGERKRLTKSEHEEVYNKYNGHCAYCGCKLDYKDMQVDHIVSVYWHDGENVLDNYNPACRMCNFYKSTYDIEGFRDRIRTIPERLENVFIYRMAKKYGIINDNYKDNVTFYFEIHDMAKKISQKYSHRNTKE